MEKSKGGRWPAYAASVCAGSFAAVSLYWAAGGTGGVRSVGGIAERMARSDGAGAIAGIWAVVAVKAGGAIVALSLVRPWGAIFPRRWRGGVAGAGAVILTVYGGVLVAAEGLVALKVIKPSQPVDWNGLYWHLGLWDAWFLIWGLLLGAATWRFLRHSPRTVPSGADVEIDRAPVLSPVLP